MMILEFNVFEVFMNMFDPLVELASALFDWVTSEVTIFGYSFTPLALAAPIVIAIMIISFVRE